MDKRIGCRKCSRYSHQLQRCIDGKINPKTIGDARNASSIMGIGYICDKNGMRYKLIEGMVKK